MNNNNYSIAKVLTLIPVIVLVVTVLCLVIATILEVPTSRGAIYTVFAFIGVVSLFVSPLPCLVISIVGTVFAAKAAKEDTGAPKTFLILGIMEILVYVVGVFLAVALFLGSQSV